MNLRFFFLRKYEDYFRKIIPDEEKFGLREVVEKKFSEVYPNYFALCQSEIGAEETVKLDFNFGLRLEVPAGNFQVRISDADSGTIFFDDWISNTRLISLEKYFVKWRVEVRRSNEIIFEHTLDLEKKSVLVDFQNSSLEEFLILIPSVREFQRENNCTVYLALPEFLKKFTAKLYPDLAQVKNFSGKYFYASYYPLIDTSEILLQNFDVRNMKLESIGERIFGLKNFAHKAEFVSDEPRKFSEPYACISVQPSEVSRGWYFPEGWERVTYYLKSMGLRVFCVDDVAETVHEGYTAKKPKASEFFKGRKNLLELANFIHHAEFFVGVTGGLSWLAHAVNCPVVMIGGFSQDWHEFYTPHRVLNRLTCYGCFNDVRANLNENFCPYYHGRERELECQKKISPRQVFNEIDKLVHSY